MFNLNEYKKTKLKVIDMIKQTHRWDTSEGFIADGLISPKDYQNTPIKIAVFLGESYGYDNCGIVDIETQPNEDVLGIGNITVQTSKKIPVLLWMLYKSFEEKKLIPWDDIPYLLQLDEKNMSSLQNSLKKVAWINVKKASKHIDKSGKDATRQIDNEIYEHAKKNKEILKLQIESISPDLFIICSNPVFDSLFDMGLLGKTIKKNKKWTVQTNDKNIKIIHVSHPSYFKDWGYEGMYKTCKIIFESFSNKE